MTFFQLELIVLTLSSFVVGLLIGLLFAITVKPESNRCGYPWNGAEKCPWCGRFKKPGKICKCEE